MALLHRVGDDVEVHGTDPPLVARVTAVRGERVRVAYADRGGWRFSRGLTPAQLRQVTPGEALGGVPDEEPPGSGTP